MAVCYENHADQRDTPHVAGRIFNVKPGGTYGNFRAFKCLYTVSREHEMEHLLEALRYKKEGRGFDCQWCHFSLT